MPTLLLLAVVAFVLFIGAALAVALRREASPVSWGLPAAVAGVFAVLSSVAVAVEGPFGFWAEHTDSLWGVQVWADLLLALAVGWAFVVPRAKALGVRPLPWLALILLTGSIGLLALVARVLYLESRVEASAAVAPA